MPTNPVVADHPSGRVVVGVDGSDASRTALLWAANYARRCELPLEAIMTWQIGSIRGYPILDVEDAVKNTTVQALHDSIVATLGEDSGTIETVVRGAATLALLKAAHSASLLVVGSRGRGAFSGMLLGSVSQHCVHHATCPVVVIPTPAEGEAGRGGGAPKA